MLCFFQFQFRRVATDVKAGALHLLQSLAKDIMNRDAAVPSMGLCTAGCARDRRRVNVTFTPQGLTHDWGTLLGHSPAAKRVWGYLQTAEWCKQRVVATPPPSMTFCCLCLI